MVSTQLSKPCPSVADTPDKRAIWWTTLEPQWQTAFQLAFFGHTNPVTDADLVRLWQTPVLRFVGPKAPYANLTFKLTNCSGLAGMSNLEILVLTNHQIETIAEVASMVQLKSLFVNNNALKTLTGIERLTNLEQLYAQMNAIETLTPLRNLTNLREIYVNVNSLKNLNGITHKHSKALKTFFCLPNDALPDREVIRVERNLGIRCRAL